MRLGLIGFIVSTLSWNIKMIDETDRHIPVIIHGRNSTAYAKGGLASAGKDVADSGRGGDTMAVHVNKGEFDEMRQRWGDPTINPKTGLPEFTPFYKQSWFAPVASAVGSISGLGGYLGDAIGGATGLVDAGSTASNALGSGLLGAGIGGLSNGVSGALMGGLTGAATPYVTSALGFGGTGYADHSGSAVAGLLGGSSGGSDAGAATASSGGAGGGLGGLMSGGLGGMSPQKLGAITALLSAFAPRNGNSYQRAAAGQNAQAQAAFNQHLQPVVFNRVQTPMTQSQYMNYGYNPGVQQLQNNELPTTAQSYARGGKIRQNPNQGQPQGQSPLDGRADVVPAKLSHGEYIMDAGTVSALGNGSTDAGAQALDQMRQNIRQHIGPSLAKGQFPPDAKSPLQYLSQNER